METAQRAGTAGGAQLQHKLPRMSASNGAGGSGSSHSSTATAAAGGGFSCCRVPASAAAGTSGCTLCSS